MASWLAFRQTSFHMYLSVYLSVCLSTHPSIHPWLYSPLLGLGRFFSFLMYTQSVGLLGRGSHVARPLSTHRTTQIQNKRSQTSMSWVGFEPTIPAFELAKTVHALDCADTVICRFTSVFLNVFVSVFRNTRHTGGGQSNGNTKKLRKRICLCWLH
jgi:hypothetical protein